MADEVNKFTPGPWKLEIQPGGVRVLSDDGEVFISRLYAAEGGDEDSEGDARTIARARLISAAPDLLAACKKMSASLNGSPSDFAGMLAAHRALDAAIAEAEGAPDARH